MIRVKMRILASLENTFYLLRFTEPETWSKESRIDILSTLSDQCSRTNAFKLKVYSQQEALSTYFTRWNNLIDIPSKAHTDVPPLEPAKLNSKSGSKCYFLETDSVNIDNSTPWVYVPEWLIEPGRLPSSTVKSTATVTELLLSSNLTNAQPNTNSLNELDQNVSEPPTEDTSAKLETNDVDSVGEPNARASRSTRGVRKPYVEAPTRNKRQRLTNSSELPRPKPVAVEYIASMVATTREIAIRERLKYKV
jgi:hypothetical protein